jgi:hypothetical protein
MPNTKEKGKLIEVLSKHIPYGYATMCLIADELMADGVRLEEKRATSDGCITKAAREKLWRIVKEAIHSWESDVNMSDHITDNLIAHGVTVQEWFSVKDRFPGKMGQYVCRYVFGENTDYPFYQVLWYFANLEKPHFQHEGSMGLTVTHWMPLPKPPKGE